jgi:CHAD domain-containing protein
MSKQVRKKTDNPSVPNHEENLVEPSFADAMRDLIGKRWGAVWIAVPVAIEGADPEGVHDVRVASRRLRAAMDVAAICFPSSWYKPLHRTAKTITQELGEVRDRDVLIDALMADRAAAPPEEWPGIDRLIARIDRERIEARAEMERFLTELESSKVPDEVVKRFGGDATAPWRASPTDVDAIGGAA